MHFFVIFGIFLPKNTKKWDFFLVVWKKCCNFAAAKENLLEVDAMPVSFFVF